MLVHTHPCPPGGSPDYPLGYPYDMGHVMDGVPPVDGSDIAKGAPRSQGKPQAVVYDDGSVRYYDGEGPLGSRAPKGQSPVGPDGVIDGQRH